MKKYLVICLLLVSGSLFAQTSSEIQFPVVTHDFGKIKQHVPASFTFTFTNKSSKPVVIEVASADCGCTNPEYSKAPILKGKSSDIKVTYNAENAGSFKKNVTVKFANVTDAIILTINGEVEAAKPGKK